MCHEISLIFPPAQIGNEEALLIISRPKICSWTFIDNRNSPSPLCRVSLYFERFFMTSNDHRTCSCLKMVMFTAVLVTTQQSYIQVPSKYVPSRDFWNAKFLLIKSPSPMQKVFWSPNWPRANFQSLNAIFLVEVSAQTPSRTVQFVFCLITRVTYQLAWTAQQQIRRSEPTRSTGSSFLGW